MLLTSRVKIRLIEHDVRPTKHRQLHGAPQHRSQIEAMLDVGAADQWIVWAFPNRDHVHSAWQFEEEPPVDASIAARPPARLVFADTLDDLLRKVRWDEVADRVATFGDAVDKMRSAYGEHHAFVAARFDRNGTYSFAWKWYGSEPYACTSWIGQPPADTTVTMRGATVIEWVTPGLGDPGPKGQRATGGAVRVQLGGGGRCSDVVGRCSTRPKSSLDGCAVM